ncbi:hypothetical protein MUK42_22534 [Musa troglodytarum]|uniref:Uncharacterized protein n=1 Tax=Musa troglodytarum TaxID=320322 RepID=A0A9E7I087_9LILI|nr:hypothetical protein MUK42_22534 [Musa troglodytarum]
MDKVAELPWVPASHQVDANCVELSAHWALGSVRLYKKPNKSASPTPKPKATPFGFFLSSGIAGSCAPPSLHVDPWWRLHFDAAFVFGLCGSPFFLWVLRDLFRMESGNFDLLFIDCSV